MRSGFTVFIYHRIILVTSAALVLSGCILSAPATQTTGTLESKFTGLSSGPLRNATVANLSSDVILSMQGLTIRTSDLSKKIAGYPASARTHLSKYQFFALEQMAVQKILTQEAQTWASKNNVSTSSNELIREYLLAKVPKKTVSNWEISKFYNENKDMFEGATLIQVKMDLKAFLEGEKRQAAIDRYINSIGTRHSIQVSNTWVSGEYKKWINNPVERARRTGKPTLAEFNREKCEACRIMAPRIDVLRKEHKGRLNVITVNVEKEPILASHYRADSIPLYNFYDKSGKEFDMHIGVISRNDIDKKLSKIGIK